MICHQHIDRPDRTSFWGASPGVFLLLDNLLSGTGSDEVILYATIVIAALLLVRPLVEAIRARFDKNSQHARLAAVFDAFVASCDLRCRTLEKMSGQYILRKGNEFDARSAATEMRQRLKSLHPEKEIEQFQSLLSEPHAARIVSVLSELVNRIKFQDRHTADFLDGFTGEYEKNVQAYYENMYRLTGLHDELAQFVKGKSLNREGGQWTQGFFAIFRDWVAKGSGKDMETIRNEVILKLIALNKSYPAIPFVSRTNEIAFQCEAIYDKTAQLDADFHKNLEENLWASRIAAKVVRHIRQGMDRAPAPLAATGVRTKPAFGHRQTAMVITLLLFFLPAAWFGIEYLSTAGNSRSDTDPAAETPILYMGHSLPIPQDTDLFQSHTEHYTAVKVLIDSINRTLDTPLIAEPAYGIDVSHYQGKINWRVVGADTTSPRAFHFVILKATQGLEKDRMFDYNWAGAQRTADKIGAYHFFTFKDDPLQQARHFIRTVRLGKGNIRPVVDVEANCGSCSNTGNLTKDQLIRNLKIFLHEIESFYRCKAIIYSGHAYYHTYLKGHFPDNAFWLAQYSKKKQLEEINPLQSLANGSGRETVVCWQFSPLGSLDGIRGNVDLNFLPGHFREEILIR